MVGLVVVIIFIASGFYCSVVAGEKGYNRANWFLGGLFFGFLALFAAVGLPNKKLERYIRRIGLKQEAFSENDLEFKEISKSGENENNILVPIKYDSEEIWSFLLSKTNNKHMQAVLRLSLPAFIQVRGRMLKSAVENSNYVKNKHAVAKLMN